MRWLQNKSVATGWQHLRQSQQKTLGTRVALCLQLLVTVDPRRTWSCAASGLECVVERRRNGDAREQV
jgi:hypothetical protein